MFVMRPHRIYRALGLGVALVWVWQASLADGQTVLERPADGFRELRGRHLTLTTDAPPAADVDELLSIFDQAVAQWCEYFLVSPERTASWHMRGYLMVNRDRFLQAGLLPAELPAFPHGYQRGDRLWLMEQSSPYYRRHLLLHEGTHGFMAHWLGGTGPPWFMEGVAEQLATHRYQEGRLQLNVMPRQKDDVPEWGRIKLLRQSFDAGSPFSLDEVFEFRSRRFSDVEAYAWSWAAATFLDGHPRWHDRFRELTERVDWSADQFRAQLQRDLWPDAALLREAWELFLSQLDYGYDVAEDQVIERPPRSWRDHATFEIDSRLGWQSTGLALIAGRRYQLSAQGQFRLNDLEPPWVSGPGGVTIRYHQGRPTGMLLAAIRAQPTPTESSGLLRPLAVGTGADLLAHQDGILFLRINERAGHLGDNLGRVQGEVHDREPDASRVGTRGDD